jgi:hypothetical protein
MFATILCVLATVSIVRLGLAWSEENERLERLGRKAAEHFARPLFSDR